MATAVFRRLQRRLIKFAPAIVSTTSRYTGLFVVRDVAASRARKCTWATIKKSSGLDCRRINTASGVHTDHQLHHTTLCIRMGAIARRCLSQSVETTWLAYFDVQLEHT